jgi:tape measure domain-containing protein
MDGVFLALGQMISKGKVQAEELRGQLGERLPGAFNLAARAMGVTTAQLDDMLKKGQVTAEDMLPKLAAVLKDEFGPAAEHASQGAQGAVNRLSTEWNLFKATVMDNKGIIAAINAITGALENRNQAMMKAARREAAIKSLEEDGVIKQGEKEVTDVNIASGAVTVQKIKFYTEEQIKARMGLEKAWEAHNKHSKQLQEEETKIIADGSAATKNFLKNSTEGKKSALQEDYNNTLKALNAQITVYKKQGQDVSGLEQERLKITAEYQRQLESINKKGTKSAETAAKRAAVSGINLDELRKSVEALEAANIPAAKSFDQMAEKIREQSNCH